MITYSGAIGRVESWLILASLQSFQELKISIDLPTITGEYRLQYTQRDDIFVPGSIIAAN